MAPVPDPGKRRPPYRVTDRRVSGVLVFLYQQASEPRRGLLPVHEGRYGGIRAVGTGRNRFDFPQFLHAVDLRRSYHCVHGNFRLHHRPDFPNPQQTVSGAAGRVYSGVSLSDRHPCLYVYLQFLCIFLSAGGDRSVPSSASLRSVGTSGGRMHGRLAEHLPVLHLRRGRSSRAGTHPAAAGRGRGKTGYPAGRVFSAVSRRLPRPLLRCHASCPPAERRPSGGLRRQPRQL